MHLEHVTVILKCKIDDFISLNGIKRPGRTIQINSDVRSISNVVALHLLDILFLVQYLIFISFAKLLRKDINHAYF